MNAIANAGTLVDKGRSPSGYGPIVLDVRSGDPDARQVIAAQQVGEHPSIDFVRLDVGLGNRLGFEWVGDHDVGDVGPHEPDERPGVAGDLDGELVGRAEVLGGEAANFELEAQPDWSYGRSDMVAGSKPIPNFERPLDDRPPGKALFRLENERTTVIVQPGIRLHEGSATAARLFDGRSERNREEGRGWGFGGGNWGL